ncbi:hypothetical protein BSKO_13523 [Bryopsis sp. KO-2023]|nr:hypothetical protein BSKO_13523 [Bryopsis sp. KO-2023]
MVSQRRAVHGNRKKCGTVLSHVAIFLLFAVILVALSSGVVGAQKCDAIFEGGDFSVTRAVLDEVKDDFQMLLDCVPQRGTLAIEPGLNIKPSTTVVVKNAIEVTSRGKGEKRPVLTCPDVGQPLFEISSTGVELKNFVVSDCMTDSNVTSAIVVDIEKDKNSKTTSLEINGVDFVNNTNLNGTASIFIKSAGSLSLAKVVFSRNVGLETGGLYLHSAAMQVNVRDCVFEENRARFFGGQSEGKGAVLFQDVPAFIAVTGSRFLNNFAEREGGAMYIEGEPPASGLTITNTEFHNNTAAQGSGGVLWASGPTFELTVKNCTFTENKARAFGGTIHLRTSIRSGEIKIEIEDSVFEKNIALAGGALWALANIQWRMGISISNSKFLRNEALLQHTGPGEIFEQAISQSTTSAGTGGAITCIGVSVDLKFKGNLFEKNTAIGLGGVDQRGSKGGAIAITDLQNVTITDTVFRENSAINLDTLGHEAVGGAIFLAAGGIKAARVSDSPRGSKCELQCDSSSTTILSTTVDVVAGCGTLDGNGRRICVLTNRTECEGVIPEENLVGLGEEELAATCKIIVINSIVRMSDTKFLDNTVDGAGGAIFVTEEEGATLRLGKGVEFLRNTAKNSSGGAMFLQDGPCLFAEEEMIVKHNVASLHGGGIVLEGASAELTLQGASFEGNRAERGNGGAITVMSVESNVTITGPTAFRGNEAGDSGGALAFSSEDSSVKITDATFLQNKASTAGGALHAGSTRGTVKINLADVLFSENHMKAGPDLPVLGKGGAISMEGAAVMLSISGKAKFMRNSAWEGGAVHIADAKKFDVFKAVTLFHRNEAGESGGAIACLSFGSNVSLADATFSDNRAALVGGAIYAKSTRGAVNIDLKDVSFSGNQIKPASRFQLQGKGGAIAMEGAAIALSISGKANTFVNNSAREGGAIQVFNTKKVDILQASFTDNVALSGGGLHIFFTRNSSDLAINITNVDFIGNKAYMGGGLLADAKNANFAEDKLTEVVFLPPYDLKPPQILLNRVRFHGQQVLKHGGAMFLIDVHAAGENCDFQDNRIEEGFGGGGGAVKLADFARLDLTSGRFTGNQAVDGGAVIVSKSFFAGKNLDFSKNTAFGKGGSISIEGPLQGEGSMVTLEDSRIDGNVAQFGGGIFGDVLESESVKACQSASQALHQTLDLDFVQNMVVDACQTHQQSSLARTLSLFLNNTVISNNKAKKAGGGIFTGNPSLVCACCGTKCSESCRLIGLKSDFGFSRVCSESWLGNSHGRRGYGPTVASFGSTGEIIKSDGALLQENEILDDSHSSGQPIDSLKVKVKDYFDQVVAIKRRNVLAQITSVSTGIQILFGQVDSQVKKGVANFNATIVSGFPGDYRMRLSFPGLEVENRHFRVRVRECGRGENIVRGQFSMPFTCRRCEPNNFSFRPSQSCKPCPTSTTCDTTTLTPIDGYWHSSSWSESIHKCLVDVACSYTNRSTILRMESERSGQAPLHFKNQPLCREGYEGPLCGSCAKGYGRVRAFECEKCFAKGISIPLMAATVVWMLIFVGFIIRNALKAGTPANTRVNSVRNDNLESSPAIYLGVNPVTENAKILINFLQITSIALVINVEWREEVQRVLQIEDLASGFSTSESILSFDCPLVESSVPVSIRRTILAMLLPFTMIVLPAFFAFKGCFDKSRSQLFYRQAFVSVLVVAYVFYTGMTRRALRILHGVSLDECGAKDSSVLFAQGRFWADDTKIRYFEGDHAYLATLLGLPVLLFYSFGFPGYLFYVLWGNKGKLNDESFAKSYGFLYRAYHNNYVYWEIVVMARKVLLVAVVVFAFELGGNLQSVLAVAVLLAALILHLHSQPYREELSQMNHRETLSLCVSVFTYLAGIAFNDDRLPVLSEILLSFLLVVTTIGFVVYLVLALAADSARHLEKLLEEREVPIPENATTWQKLWLLVNFYWYMAMDYFWHCVEQGLTWCKGKKP